MGAEFYLTTWLWPKKSQESRVSLLWDNLVLVWQRGRVELAKIREWVWLSPFRSPVNINKWLECATSNSKQSVFLSCRSRDDIPIVNNDRFRITQTSKAVQLAIEHVQKDDTGYYTLYARTKSGETLRKDVELIAEDRSVGSDPPVFLRRLGDLSVKVGTRTRLLVEIRSSTELKVSRIVTCKRKSSLDVPEQRDYHLRHVHIGETRQPVFQLGACKSYCGSKHWEWHSLLPMYIYIALQYLHNHNVQKCNHSWRRASYLTLTPSTLIKS